MDAVQVTKPIQLQPVLLDKRTLLDRHPVFRDLDRRLIERIVEHAVVRKVKGGTVLFRKGDDGSRLYAVLSGMVRISTGSSAGKDAVFTHILPGEIFGEIAVLDGSTRSADAATVDSCELMAIERRDFIPLLHEFPALGIRLIELLCARLRHTSEQVEDIVFLDLANRLAKVLLYLHDRAPSGTSQKPIRITQRELSQMVGATRESTNKQLRKWERSKVLKMDRGTLTLLAPGALIRLVSEDAAQ
jgi:CRP-like cAMP-binding protein